MVYQAQYVQPQLNASVQGYASSQGIQQLSPEVQAFLAQQRAGGQQQPMNSGFMPSQVQTQDQRPMQSMPQMMQPPQGMPQGQPTGTGMAGIMQQYGQIRPQGGGQMPPQQQMQGNPRYAALQQALMARRAQ